jgi:hypothetical protein
MLRASIFQKNILRENQKSKLVESFNNNLVEINETSLKIFKNNKIVLSTSLKKIEEDFNTATYVGTFSDNFPFRVIRPNDIPLENIRKEFQCVSAFSIASVKSDEYAIHFILTEENDIRNNQSIEKGSEEQIQRLLEGCVLALQNNLHENFIDFTKRLIALINNINELYQYKYGPEILQIMKDNDNIYSTKEREKIYT